MSVVVHVAAFACGWALMSLEILGGRILTPSFGGGVYTWGSLISTFLVALSVGYLLGGALSRRNARLSVLAALVALSGVMLVTLPSYVDPVCDAIFERDLGDRMGPLLAALTLFTLPGILMGMVSPYSIRLAATHIENVGASSGTLYAVSTMGSTLGTLATTFFLIPSVGVRAILTWTGAALCVLAVLVYAAGLALGRRQLAAALLALSVLSSTPSVAAGERILLSKDSPHAKIIVSEQDSIRILRFTRRGIQAEESRIDLKAPYRMLNEYTSLMMASLAFVSEPKDVLVVGLGGGIVPRALRKHYPHARIDVVEIDPTVVEVARDYFMYRPDAAMQTIVSDARVYVKRARKQYDIIYLDAFLGKDIPFHLKTREFLEEVKRIVRPGGIVVGNVHRGPRLYSSERQTYAAAFGTTYGFGGRRSANVAIVCFIGAGPQLPKSILMDRARGLQAQKRFDFDLPFEVSKLLDRPDWDTKAPILTDDYAPVEILNER